METDTLTKMAEMETGGQIKIKTGLKPGDITIISGVNLINREYF